MTVNNTAVKNAMLIILDGWGIAKNPIRSAIDQGDTPFMDELLKSQPNSQLITSGESVGLPEGQMGNSEVGHMTIGAGQIIPQELLRINRSISNGEFATNKTILSGIKHAKKYNKKIHLIGLVSDGGVHSHINHLKALCDICRINDCDKVHIHALLDGRDTPPTSGINYIEDLLNHLKGSEIKISSLIGRYYAMDRDKRWERVKRAYELLRHAEAVVSSPDPVEALRTSYQNGITDEFIEPTKIETPSEKWDGHIEKDDVVIFFNFRIDRPRELTEVLTQKPFPSYNMEPLPLFFISMKPYDSSFNNIEVIFEDLDRKTNIGSYIASCGLTQLRIAETEKYAHVTYFLSGGREHPYEGEKRIMIPSPKVATYDMKPDMSAKEVTKAAMSYCREHQPNLVILNYANADMVGHTGSFKAAMAAVKEVDQNLKELISFATKNKYEIIIIADHGNADYMINDDGTAHTAHTTNPVPCIIISEEQISQIRDGFLYDIAPTLLDLMGLDIPIEMTGQSLV